MGGVHVCENIFVYNNLLLVSEAFSCICAVDNYLLPAAELNMFYIKLIGAVKVLFNRFVLLQDENILAFRSNSLILVPSGISLDNYGI